MRLSLITVSKAAAVADAVQHDLVIFDGELEPLGQLVDRRLERLVVERDEPAARAADEVVVVLAGRVDRLVARRALAELEALHEPVVDERVQNPVDARAPDRALAGSQRVLDLLGRARARLPREDVDDRVAGGSSAMASAIECLARVLGPDRGPLGARSHGDTTAAGACACAVGGAVGADPLKRSVDTSIAAAKSAMVTNFNRAGVIRCPACA